LGQDNITAKKVNWQLKLKRKKTKDKTKSKQEKGKLLSCLSLARDWQAFLACSSDTG